MIKKITLMILAAVFSGTVLAENWTTVRIGVEGAYPPFSQTNADGSITGFDIDIANALCAEIGAKCTMVAQDWDGMIPALLAHKYDAIIASMSITEERKKVVAFTDKYYSAPARFIKKTRDPNLKIFNSLMKGLKVGVQRETAMDRFLTDNWKDIVEIRHYNTQEDANNDLLTNRLDLLFAEVGPGDDFIKTHPEKAEFVGPTYTDERWFGEGIGIAIRKQDNDLRKQLNNAIAKIRADGTYNRIQKQYFDFDIYGE